MDGPETASQTEIREVPPLPIKTYKWEDVKRSRRKGGYPWTYLDKDPFDAAMESITKSRSSNDIENSKSEVTIQDVTEERMDTSDGLMVESADSSADVSISQYLDKDESGTISSEEILELPARSERLSDIEEEEREKRAKSEEPRRKRKHSIESSYSRVSKYSLSKLGLMKRLKETKIKLPKFFSKSESKLDKKVAVKKVEPQIVEPKKIQGPLYIHIPLKPPPGQTDEFSYLEFEDKPKPKEEIKVEAKPEDTKQEVKVETPRPGVQFIILTAPSDDEILDDPTIPETPSESEQKFFDNKRIDELKSMAKDVADKYSPETKRRNISKQDGVIIEEIEDDEAKRIENAEGEKKIQGKVQKGGDDDAKRIENAEGEKKVVQGKVQKVGDDDAKEEVQMEVDGVPGSEDKNVVSAKVIVEGKEGDKKDVEGAEEDKKVVEGKGGDKEVVEGKEEDKKVVEGKAEGKKVVEGKDECKKLVEGKDEDKTVVEGKGGDKKDVEGKGGDKKDVEDKEEDEKVVVGKGGDKKVVEGKEEDKKVVEVQMKKEVDIKEPKKKKKVRKVKKSESLKTDDDKLEEEKKMDKAKVEEKGQIEEEVKPEVKMSVDEEDGLKTEITIAEIIAEDVKELKLDETQSEEMKRADEAKEETGSEGLKDKGVEAFEDKGVEVKDKALKDKVVEVKDKILKDKGVEVKDKTLKDKGDEVNDKILKDKGVEVKDKTLKDKGVEVKDKTLKDEGDEVKVEGLKGNKQLKLKIEAVPSEEVLLKPKGKKLSPILKKKVSFKRRSKEDSEGIYEDVQVSTPTKTPDLSQSMSVDEERTYLDQKIIKETSLEEDYNKWSKLNDHEYEPINAPSPSSEEPKKASTPVTDSDIEFLAARAADIELRTTGIITVQDQGEQTKDKAVFVPLSSVLKLDRQSMEREERKEGEGHGKKLQEAIKNQGRNLRRQASLLGERASSQAEKIHTRVMSIKRTKTTKKQEVEEPKPKTKSRFNIKKPNLPKLKIHKPTMPKFNKPSMPKMNRPTMPKISKPNFDRLKIDKAKLSKLTPKIDQMKLPSFKRKASSQRRHYSTESTAGDDEDSKTNIFDFSTYPRMFRKKRDTSDSDDLQTPRNGTDVTPTSERSTLPRFSKWKGKFTKAKEVEVLAAVSVMSKESERSTDTRESYRIPLHSEDSMDRESLDLRCKEDREDSVERRMALDQASNRYEDDIEMDDAYTKETHRASSLNKLNERWSHGKFHEKLEDEQRSFGDIRRNDEFFLTQTRISLDEDKRSFDDINPRGDMQQINRDEFFTRQKRIPQHEDKQRSFDDINPSDDMQQINRDEFFSKKKRIPQHEDKQRSFDDINPRGDMQQINRDEFFSRQQRIPQHEDKQRSFDDINPNDDMQQINRDEFFSTQKRIPQEQRSFGDIHRRGVLEEINADEFFLRQKGISQDDIEVGEYLSSEIREAFKTPNNALFQMQKDLSFSSQNLTTSDTSLPEPPKRRTMKKPQRKKTPHVSQELYDRDSIHTEPESYPKYYDFEEPQRPIRKSERNFEDNLDFGDQILSNEECERLENCNENMLAQPKEFYQKQLEKMYENEKMAGIEQPGIIVSDPYQEAFFRASFGDTPSAPPRKHRSLKSLNDSISDELNGYKEIPQRNIESYRLEHEYQIPTPEEAPKRPRRFRSRTRSQSHNPEDEDYLSKTSSECVPCVEEPCRTMNCDYMGYSTINKANRDPPLPPSAPRRKRSIKSSDNEKFSTVPRTMKEEPVRPLRNYSTLGPSRPPREKRSVPNLTDEEKENVTASQYIEIEDDYHGKNLQSGEIIKKMKDRPLPAPPRPPRRGKDSGSCRTPLPQEVEFEEAEASVQTEPLSDEFELVRDVEDRVMTPSVDKEARKNVNEFEHQETITHAALLIQPFQGEVEEVPMQSFEKSTERIITVRREFKDEEEDSEIPEDFKKLKSPVSEEDLKNINVLRASKLQVGDLDVDRLAVGELLASKIKVAEIDSSSINVGEINSNSGNLVVSGIELPASFLQQLVDKLQGSSKEGTKTPEPSAQSSMECTKKEEDIPELEEMEKNGQKKTPIEERTAIPAKLTMEAPQDLAASKFQDSSKFEETPSDKLLEISCAKFEETPLQESPSSKNDDTCLEEAQGSSSFEETLLLETPSSKNDDTRFEDAQGSSKFEETPLQETPSSKKDDTRFEDAQGSSKFEENSLQETPSSKKDDTCLEEAQGSSKFEEKEISQSQLEESSLQIPENSNTNFEGTSSEVSQRIPSSNFDGVQEIPSRNFKLISEAMETSTIFEIPSSTVKTSALPREDFSEPQEHVYEIVEPLDILQQGVHEYSVIGEGGAVENIGGLESRTVYEPREVIVDCPVGQIEFTFAPQTEEVTYENSVIFEIRKCEEAEEYPVPPTRTKASQLAKTKFVSLSIEEDDVVPERQIEQNVEIDEIEREEVPSVFPIYEDVIAKPQEVPPPRPPQPTLDPTYIPSQPPASFFALRSPQGFQDFDIDDDIPLAPRRRRHHKTVQLQRSSSSEDVQRSSSRRRHRTPEPSIPQLTGQLTRACVSVADRSLRRLIQNVFDYVLGKVERDKQDLNVVGVILLILIVGLLLWGQGDKTVHHHHWEYFNPPTDI